jgi:hypothetical protein
MEKSNEERDDDIEAKLNMGVGTKVGRSEVDLV